MRCDDNVDPLVGHYSRMLGYFLHVMFSYGTHGPMSPLTWCLWSGVLSAQKIAAVKVWEFETTSERFKW